MSEANVRHYARIARASDDYLAGAASLEVTISTLEGLIAALEDISPDLRNQFLARWGLLEDLYATSLDQPERRLIEINRDRLRVAVAEIRDAAYRRAGGAGSDDRT